MNCQPSIVWSPTSSFIREELCAGEELRLVVAPFISASALRWLIDSCATTEHLKVITRWTAQDIGSGVSDLDVYPLLQDRKIPLYLNQTIHLKLLVFAANWAFVTSGNITKKGLGLAQQSNVEVGCRADLTHQDWSAIYGLLAESFPVDEKIYEQAVAYRDENQRESGALPGLDLAPEKTPDFSILSLPATDSPSELVALYSGGKTMAAESVSAYMNDVTLFGIPNGLEAGLLLDYLEERFTSQPFTQAIVALIKEAGSARFGLVNKWLQSNCSDKPTPYRWELKPATNRLYNWLEYFYDEISWDRPQHSMVIRWDAGQAGG